jgi:predicted TIM-barrel fold metal-dependent hydrolase
MSRHIGAVDVLFQPPCGTCAPPAEALAAMDAAGIAVAFVSQCKQWSCERQWMCVDTRLEDVARFTRESVRFAGLSGYNPFDVAESIREMEAARSLGFRGTYFHAASFGIRLSDPRLYPLFAKSSELAQAVVVQLALGEPDLVRCTERICRDFPDLLLALVHPRPDSAMLGLCSRFEQLAYVTDSATLAWIYAHERDGLNDPTVTERCIWGSNAAPLAEAVAAVIDLSLPTATLEAILRSNALRYFAATPPQRQPQGLSDAVTVAER